MTNAEALVEIAKLVTIIVGLLIAAATAAAVAGTIKAPREAMKVWLAIIGSGRGSRMAVGLFIISAISSLRILDKISAEATIALLSTIAGYVLGRASAELQRRRPIQPDETSS